MIDPKKTYKTRDGHDVRIYAVDGGRDMPVHGAECVDGGWIVRIWTSDGRCTLNGTFPSGDLIEVKPRIKKEVRD